MLLVPAASHPYPLCLHPRSPFPACPWCEQLTMGNSSSSGGGGARSFMVLGFQNTAELVCSSTNLRGGASVLHVLSLHK